MLVGSLPLQKQSQDSLKKNIMGQLVMLGTFSFVYSFYVYTRQVSLHGQWSEAGE